ncbi:hypothetical protein CASFOL_020428 [Castilleja foliolosa]|uniref:Uncharacterized protein n=1 Tax=Castilleja foliolosa TaxID=1961234 RepID=A0ABD3D2T9_9LAMI
MATVAELRQLQWIGDSHSSRRRDAVMEVAGWCWAEGSTAVIAGFTGGVCHSQSPRSRRRPSAEARFSSVTVCLCV